MGGFAAGPSSLSSDVRLADRPPAIELCHDAVHIWRASLEVSDADNRLLWGVLDETEQDRARRFLSARHRRYFVACRGQLRRLLAQYLAIAPDAIRFTVGEFGKPRLLNSRPDQGLVFNVSHSEACALIAVGFERMLGVDIECWRDLSNMEAMVDRYLSAGEQQHWLSLPLDRRTSCFYAFWTRKESFVKAVGRGISLGLQRCVIERKPLLGFVQVPEGCGAPGEWSLLDLPAGDRMSAAVSVRGARSRFFYGTLGQGWWDRDGFDLPLRRIK